MRLMPKVAASVSAKMMAGLPMPVPTTTRANGCTAAMKMTNGIGRKKLTSTLSTRCTGRFGVEAAARG